MSRATGPLDGAVRISDVAALAGVSVGTVSNTINHPDRVRRPTREAVERAIAELGFVPNLPARALSGASSQIIGLVVLDIVSPFYMAAARAVERAAMEEGCVLVLCNSDNSPDQERELLRMLQAHRARGVLINPSLPDNSTYRVWTQNGALPIVYLDHEESTGDCSASVDNRVGARLAVRHLLDLGHERIAFVSGPRQLRQFEHRSEGVRAEILAHGLDPSRALVEVEMPGFGIQDGVQAAEHLLAEGLPTGVFCGNDMVAFGFHRRIRRAGIRVPDDVALVGFDDIDFAADWVVPLTSVRQPTDELGYRAAKLLFDHTSGDPEHEHRQVVLSPELIVRGSSDPHATHPAELASQ